MYGQERNIVVYVILTIVTCGIFGLYWMAVLTNDMLNALGEDGTTGGLAVLFTIFTCGIYGIYWAYQTGQRIDRLNTIVGKYTDNSGLLYLILDILGLSIIVYAVAQSELNKFYTGGPVSPNGGY